MAFKSTIDARFFEDYLEGDVHRFGPIVAELDEMIEFARQYDPQSFHVDPDKAPYLAFHGVIASGWFTVALMMRLFVDHYLTHAASFGSPGVDAIRWQKPVRPGDALSVSVRVAKAVPSRSKPDRGIVTSIIEVANQGGDTVMTMSCINIIGRRPS
jgi:acyl dehydratase